MKIEITYADQHKSFCSPDGAGLVGVTVIYDGITFNVLKPVVDDDLSDDCEELLLSESCKVIIRYFDSPSVAEIVRSFSGFEGMKYIEIENSVFNLSVCV